MKLSTTIIIASLSLTGCATSPVSSSEAHQKQTTAPEYQTPTANSGRFVVNRDSGMMGGACPQHVFVDGTEIGSLWSGQSVTAYLPPGEHVAGVRSGGICGGGSSSTSFIMAPGSTKVYRVASGQSGDIKIEPSAF